MKETTGNIYFSDAYVLNKYVHILMSKKISIS